jgi:hypothetical protein
MFQAIDVQAHRILSFPALESPVTLSLFEKRTLIKYPTLGHDVDKRPPSFSRPLVVMSFNALSSYLNGFFHARSRIHSEGLFPVPVASRA